MSAIVDMTAFEQRMNTLQGFGMSGGRILRVEGRRLCESIIRQAHPRGVAQGNAAVSRDIHRIFYPAKPKVIAGATPVKDYFRLWTENNGQKVVAVERRNFRPGITFEAMREIHKRRRNNRGRVSGTDLEQRVEVRGKLNFIKRIVIPEAALKSYVKEVQAHVGRLRSGFGHAVVKLGGALNTGWIARHLTGGGKPTGFVTMQLEGARPFVVIGNTAAGAEPRLADIAKRALAGRVKAMTTNIRRMVKYGPGKAGDYGYALK